MNILVLDTIHGGDVIGKEFAVAGHQVDTVDVYRNESTIDVSTALQRSYDLIVAPVHLDPDHVLLRSPKANVISHHDAVRRLIGKFIPKPMIEITGSKGKTTTAFALAHIMKSTGILHTSAGTFLYPDRQQLWKKSITPASVLGAVKEATKISGWLIAEESLGVTGAGLLAIITSSDDYVFAAGKKRALEEKLKSAKNCDKVLLAPGIEPTSSKMIQLEDITHCSGTVCHIESDKMSEIFYNPLLKLEGYRIPLMLAGTAACLMGIKPSSLSNFQAIDGRLSIHQIHNVVIVDNANSGTNLMTTIEAAKYARMIAGSHNLTLVIGKETANGAVCEGFPDNQIIEAIRAIKPDHVILVGHSLLDKQVLHNFNENNIVRIPTLTEARDVALSLTKNGSIVLGVKTWR